MHLCNLKSVSSSRRRSLWLTKLHHALSEGNFYPWVGLAMRRWVFTRTSLNCPVADCTGDVSNCSLLLLLVHDELTLSLWLSIIRYAFAVSGLLTSSAASLLVSSHLKNIYYIVDTRRPVIANNQLHLASDNVFISASERSVGVVQRCYVAGAAVRHYARAVNRCALEANFLRI